MKKIVFVTTLPQTVFFLLGEQIEYLTKHGYLVEVITSKGIWLTSDEIAQKFNIPVHTVNFTRTITLFTDILCLFRLLFLLLKIRPDILHVSTPKASMLGVVAAWITGIKNRMYTVRGLVFLSTTKNRVMPVMFLVELLSCRLATKVFAVSDSNRDLLVRHKLCKKENVKVLGNGSSHGVDASVRFNPARYAQNGGSNFREKIKVRSNTVIFGFVGRLVKDKGIEDLVAAWKLFAENRSDVELVIIGPSVEPRDCISKECYEYLESRDDVHIYLDISDPVEYYTVMDVLVLPSYREGFPNVVLEAGAMEIPVITTNAAGCIDSVVHGETGLIIDVGNIEMLKESMLKLYSDPVLRKKIGRDARKRVLTDYSPELLCEQQEKIYEELLKNTR
jgi:glycosyltransferase involved in cell wall biosynthesis